MRLFFLSILLPFIFGITHVFALDAEIMDIRNNGESGCQDIIHDGVPTKICYKGVEKTSLKNTLTDTKWNLVSFDGKSITGVTLEFGKNTVHAKFCNTLNGQSNILGKSLIVRHIFSTKMYCEWPVMDAEYAFSKITRSSLAIEGDTLTIKSRNHHTFIWKKQ